LEINNELGFQHDLGFWKAIKEGFVIEEKQRISGEIIQCILGGRQQLADFDVERHTLP
jgi:hypothetical protein